MDEREYVHAYMLLSACVNVVVRDTVDGVFRGGCLWLLYVYAYIYTYVYMSVCACVCMCVLARLSKPPRIMPFEASSDSGLQRATTTRI